MKKTDLEKNKGLKINGKLKLAATPEELAAHSDAVITCAAFREERRGSPPERGSSSLCHIGARALLPHKSNARLALHADEEGGRRFLRRP